MSVNINYKSVPNKSKWDSLTNGDFVVIEGSPEHPIPSGLYRVFLIPMEPDPSTKDQEYIIIPLYNGPFEVGMFPYMVNQTPPTIKQLINKIHIEAEVNN